MTISLPCSLAHSALDRTRHLAATVFLSFPPPSAECMRWLSARTIERCLSQALYQHSWLCGIKRSSATAGCMCKKLHLHVELLAVYIAL